MSKKPPHIFRRLKPYYGYLLPVKWPFVGGILASLCYSVASGIGLPLMSKTAFPIIFNEQKAMEEVPLWFLRIVEVVFGENPREGLLIASVIALPLMMLVRSVAQFMSGYLMSYTGLRVSEMIRLEVFSHIQRMPLAFFQKYKSGDLLSRLMGDTQSVKQAVVELSNDLFKQPMTLLSAVGFLVYLAFKEESFFFAVLAACSAPLLILPIRAIGNKLAKKSKQLAHSGAELTSFTTESIQSPLEIRAYNLQTMMIQKFSQSIKDMLTLAIKQTKYGLFATPLIEVVAAASLSFSLYVGVSQGMSLGSFLALAFALYMAYEPVKKLGKIHGTLRALEAPLDRLEAILEEHNTVPDCLQPLAPPHPLKGEITFEDVTFSYQDQTTALKNVNCTIAPDEVVALVGSSGAGKSTFINLIARFYDPTQGRILIDGQDIKRWSKKELRDQIAYVPQMPILFNASIRDNIAVGKQQATDEEIQTAARQAFAHDFILQTAHGYETILSERGGSLSGGQRQRIALARAFLKNAPILILDEATSALDVQSEEMITRALELLMKGKTTLMIAHRESSLKAATQRLLFKDGTITSQNTP